MSILNQDGSVYKPAGSMQQFDPNSTEHDLFNVWDEEQIQIAGTPLYYYEIFINVNNIDELYVEARDKLWSQTPVCVYGYYDPIASQNALGMFGIDSPDEIMFEFNYRSILKALNHPPKIGARIFSPHKREHWVIKQRNLQVFKLWGELRLQIMCDRFQESLTTGEGKVTQKTPQSSFKLNSIKDLSKHELKFAGDQPAM